MNDDELDDLPGVILAGPPPPMIRIEKAELEELEARAQAAEADADRLANWLEWLMNWQNGPPLETYKAPWEHGMERGAAALAQHAEAVAQRGEEAVRARGETA